MSSMRRRRERWLHARISEDLDEALKREARRQRSPVSLIVRNVLESALDLVEELVEDSIEIARGSHRRSGGAKLDDVYGWQDVILNRETACVGCRTHLSMGEAAYRGLSNRAGVPAAVLCQQCLGRLRRSGHRPSQTRRENES
jgi:hypothetical protein